MPKYRVEFHKFISPEETVIDIEAENIGQAIDRAAMKCKEDFHPKLKNVLSLEE